jgi:UDP:flavonoid glycosyltransferase YjiC (YdhE family)
MRILIASTPATGHLNPLLAIAHILIAEGHEVGVLSGTALRERIENSGAGFRPLPEGADLDGS